MGLGMDQRGHGAVHPSPGNFQALFGTQLKITATPSRLINGPSMPAHPLSHLCIPASLLLFTLSSCLALLKTRDKKSAWHFPTLPLGLRLPTVTFSQRGGVSGSLQPFLQAARDSHQRKFALWVCLIRRFINCLQVQLCGNVKCSLRVLACGCMAAVPSRAPSRRRAVLDSGAGKSEALLGPTAGEEQPCIWSPRFPAWRFPRPVHICSAAPQRTLPPPNAPWGRGTHLATPPGMLPRQGPACLCLPSQCCEIGTVLAEPPIPTPTSRKWRLGASEPLFARTPVPAPLDGSCVDKGWGRAPPTKGKGKEAFS